MLKYTLNFDGMFASCATIHTEPSSMNEAIVLLENVKNPAEVFDCGELLEDRLIKLYKRMERINKAGKLTVGKEIVDEVFRVVRFKPQGKKEILLITNCLDLKANDIALIYRRRWDIEVFFRFLKQELNFSHFLSMNENGIQIVMYMTHITAMLVMIYKRENQVGYTTAVRRMSIELEALIMAIIVIESGGDIRKTQLMYPYRI